MAGSSFTPPEQFDEFRRTRLLGEGAMGQVFLCFDTMLYRQVAVKFLKDVEIAPELRDRFWTEARAIARLAHPNVVTIYRVGEIRGIPYLASEFIDGRSLDKLPLPLPFERVLSIALGLARGLALAHQRGVLHRDIKPANVMMTQGDEVKLLDFGLAKLLDVLPQGTLALSASARVLRSSRRAENHLADANQLGLDETAPFGDNPTGPAERQERPGRQFSSDALVGTPMYMAPEVWRSETATPRTDIYSLGAVLYELSSGKPPHLAHDIISLCAAAVGEDARPLAELAAAMPREFADVVDQCLRRDPQQRFGSGAELLEALDMAASMAEQAVQKELEQKRQQELSEAQALVREQQRVAEQRELDLYVEQGRQLLTEKSQPVAALLWLHRAYEGGSQNSSLAYLLADAMRLVDRSAVLVGHSDNVVQANFSHDGSRIVTASDDKTARLWDAETGRSLAVLRGHTERVSQASFSPDGQCILTASWDGTARLWDVETGKLLLILGDRGLGRVQVSFRPDGSQILTVGTDHSVRLWDAQTGHELAQVVDQGSLVTASQGGGAWIHDGTYGDPLARPTGHTGYIYLVNRSSIELAMFSPTGQRILTASKEKRVCLWDAETQDLVADLAGHTGPIVCASFSPDGSRLVTACDDNTIRLWDVGTGRLIGDCWPHSSPVACASISPDGSCLVTISQGGGARIHDGTCCEPLARATGHTGCIYQARFNPTGCEIVTASQDKTARIWDAKTGHALAVLEGHTERVSDASFSPDGDFILTASHDNTARIWVRESSNCLAVLQDDKLRSQKHEIEYARLSANGRRVLTVGHNSVGHKSALLWDAEAGKLLKETHSAGPRVRRTSSFSSFSSFSSDGRRLVTATGSNVILWDSETATPTAQYYTDRKIVRHVGFLPDGSCVIITVDLCTAWLRVVDGNKPLVRLQAPEPIREVCVSPDGSRVLTLSGHGDDGSDRTWSIGGASPSPRQFETLPQKPDCVLLWDARNGGLLGKIENYARDLTDTSFSPDGFHAISTSGGHVVEVWDMKHSATRCGELLGHSELVYHACFSTDGQRIVTASGDKTARIWDLESRKPLVVLQGHTAGVYHADFSSDGRRVATASRDQTVRIWDAHSGALLARLSLGGPAIQASFSADGRRLITHCFDATRVWDVAPETRSPKVLGELIRGRVPFRLEGSAVVPADLVPRDAMGDQSG